MTAAREVPKRQKEKQHKAGARLTRADAGCVAGVVGMGLMGASISACLLAAGHRLSCVETNPVKLRSSRRRLFQLLKKAEGEGLLPLSASRLIDRARISAEFADLKDARIVVESTIEDLTIKRQVIAAIETFVAADALIGSNTSAIPVTDLQSGCRHPERVLGLHWAEPAHITRFMEIVCGKNTSIANAHRAILLARAWGKEPSLLQKDIRGFITNRIMYAMLREAFHLVEAGYATVADVDRSLRNDYGYWMTFAGPFRFMDLTGIPAYAAVMKDLLPDLTCGTEVPRLMQSVVKSGARGVSNARGFYRYTPAQAKRWEKRFIEFSYQIRELADNYPEDVGDTGRSVPPAARRPRRSS